MKIIRNLAHGYIDLDQDDLKIVDNPFFQRLRRIRQTTTEIVYPNSHHTRFEHSLGKISLNLPIYSFFCRLLLFL